MDSSGITGTESSPRPHNLQDRLNALTHSAGIGLSIAGLAVLLVLTYYRSGGAVRYVSFSIYGTFQILLYLCSSLAHQFTDVPRIHKPLRILDQSAIYLLIAGTYTPITLLILPPRWGWWIFGIVWTMAVLGILMKSLLFQEEHFASDLLYLPMGWLILVALKPLVAHAPSGLLLWAVIGGLCYSVGVVFYMTKRIPFSHVIWHLFVLAGGFSFFYGFARYLT